MSSLVWTDICFYLEVVRSSSLIRGCNSVKLKSKEVKMLSDCGIFYFFFIYLLPRKKQLPLIDLSEYIKCSCG